MPLRGRRTLRVDALAERLDPAAEDGKKRVHRDAARGTLAGAIMPGMAAPDESSRDTYDCFSPRRFWLPLVLLVIICLLILMITLHLPMLLLVGLALGVGVYLLEAFVLGIRVKIGAEGVSFLRLGHRRFVPYEHIARVEERHRAGTGNSSGENGPARSWNVFTSVLFVLTSGAQIEVATGEHEASPQGGHLFGQLGDFSVYDRKASAIVRGVRAQLRERQERQPAELVERELSRGGRTVQAWLADLNALAAPADDSYRSSPLDKEALWNIFEDPAASASARAGAAIALRAQLERVESPRVRVALERCEAPRLRAALQVALDEEATEDDRARALSHLD